MKQGEPGLKEQDPGPIMEWLMVSMISLQDKKCFKIARTGPGTWAHRQKVWIVMILRVKWIRTGSEDEEGKLRYLLSVAQLQQFWFTIKSFGFL